jgi:hypothetical protein
MYGDVGSEMTLSRGAKVLVGAVTLWPIFYMFVFMGTFAMSFVGAGRYHEPDDWFKWLMFLHFGTMVVMLALITFYIVELFRTDRVREDRKALWAVVLFLGNMFSMPIFFWLYIWPDALPRPQEGARPSQ